MRSGRLLLRLPEKLHDLLAAYAEQHDISLNGVIVALLIDGMEHPDRAPGVLDAMRTEMHTAMRRHGAKGGAATAKNRTAEERREAATVAINARWAKARKRGRKPGRAKSSESA